MNMFPLRYVYFCRFALMINEKFKSIIAIQFVMSTLVVCSNLYQLAKITLSAQCFPLILYTCSMLTQILIYWYDNEVKLKVRIVHISQSSNMYRIIY